MSTSIDRLEAGQLRTDLPDFKPGDTIRVHARIVEGDKERIQVFEGVVLSQAAATAVSGAADGKFPMASGLSASFPATRHGLTRSR